MGMGLISLLVLVLLRLGMSPLNVRFAPESGHVRCKGGCLLRAKSGLMHHSKTDRYLITLSARASNWGAISRPRADIRARRTSDFGLKQTCTTRDFTHARPALRMPSRNLAIGPAV